MPGDSPSIAIFAGPSGGHLFPAQAYAEALQKRRPKSRRYLISSRRAEAFARNFAPGLFHEVFYLREFPFPSGISLRSARFLLEFPRAFLDSDKIIRKIQPDLCAGFGSFVSYPGMMLAAWKKIPNWIHEQNQVPGKATRMLAPHAGGVAVTFPDTFKGQPLRERRITGLPVRDFLKAASEKTVKKQGGRFRIIVVGGSQGAKNLNQIILQTFLRLSPEEKNYIAVTHITGRTDYETVRDFYRQNGISAEVHVFFEKMHELYENADMAITRAGANTLFELAMFRVPAVVIPYPYAGGHQADNAEYFAKRGALVMHPEASLTPEWLTQQIQCFRSAEFRQQLSSRMAGLASPEAGERLADWTEELLGTNNG